MIKHLDNYALSVPNSAFIQQKIDAVTSLLNRPIAPNALNVEGTAHPCELTQVYGWRSPVPEHVDKTGVIFFMPIYMESEKDELVCGDETLQLQIGHMYLLDDAKKHHTNGDGNVVSLFWGSVENSKLNEELCSQVFEKFKEYLARE